MANIRQNSQVKVKLPKLFNLDLGCGFNKQKNFIGMDRREIDEVDIIHDVEEFPWPIKDNSVTNILCSHLMEHLNPKYNIDFMDEIWRVLVSDGVVCIAVPYANSYGAHQDPTHVRPGFNQTTWAYFDPRQDLYRIYRPKPFFTLECNWNEQFNMEVKLRAIKKGSEDITDEQLRDLGVM